MHANHVRPNVYGGGSVGGSWILYFLFCSLTRLLGREANAASGSENRSCALTDVCCLFPGKKDK